MNLLQIYLLGIMLMQSYIVLKLRKIAFELNSNIFEITTENIINLEPTHNDADVAKVK